MKKNENRVYKNLYREMPTSSKPKFAVGDRVRITKKKKTFEKGYTPRWTEEVFTVSEIQYTNPVTYKIKDYNKEEIQGTFYATTQIVMKIASVMQEYTQTGYVLTTSRVHCVC